MRAPNEKYAKIFEPFKAGHGDRSIAFKNRIFVAPTHPCTGIDGLGMITEDGLNYFESFVDGGFAGFSLPVEIPPNSGHPRSFIIDNEETVAFMDFHKLARYAAISDAKLNMEIYHPGCCMIPGEGRELISASSFMYNGHFVRGMNEDDMENVIQMYVRAAITAKRAGFDVIMLHFAHGWLMNNFLSPLSNKRTDKYGGSVENRCRFPMMVLDAVRKAVDLPIELRLNGSDGENAGGITPEDAVEQMLIFQDKVDMIHLSCGNRLSADTRGEMFPSHFIEPAHNRRACQLAKKAGVKIPIGIVGAVHDPDLIEEMLEKNEIDYVLMGRQAVIERDWVNKVYEGRVEDIRPCLRCGFCNDYGRRAAISKNVTFAADSTYDEDCIIDPLHGQGIEKLKYPAPKASRKVAVIGGGIAGIQAAIRAKERGHDVTLYEKSNQLCGQVNLFKDALWFKREFNKYAIYMETQLKKSGVKVLMNTEAKPEEIRKGGYDAVLVGIGSDPATLNIPGIDKSNVIQGRDALGNDETIGKRVVVIGGGSIGCELAIDLAGKGRDVTIVELTEYLSSNSQLTDRTQILMNLKKLNVKSLLETRCLEITDNGVCVENKDGVKLILEADTIILAVGSVAKTEESHTFEDCAPEVYYIGDCLKASDIRNAVTSGWNSATRIL